MRILILKPSSLGDVVQALPVLRLLRRQFPSAEIFWWLARDLFPLLEDDRDLSGLLPFDRRGWPRPAAWWSFWQSARRARAGGFDWVLDLQALARSAFFAWLAGAKMVAGLDDPREGAPGLYDVRVPRPRPSAHAVEWYVEAARALGARVHWDFEWLPVNERARAAVLERWRPQGDPWVLLHPGARWRTKRWPAEYFAELARRLSHWDRSLRFAVIGGAADRGAGQQICGAAPGRVLDLTGQTSLSEMIEWVRCGRLLVTNDTGPMHVAAALGRPALALFGPTDPRRTGPFGQLENVLRQPPPCAPCEKMNCDYSRPFACLRELRPERVVAAAEKLLADLPLARPGPSSKIRA